MIKQRINVYTLFTMITRREAFLLRCAFVASVLFMLLGFAGCTADKAAIKDQADRQVYDIIDEKWTDDLGDKSNFKIDDTAALNQDLQVKNAVPSSGVLTLADAVAMATAHNRQYQLERENLYLKALDLTLIRYDFEPNPFATGSGGYTKETEDELTGGRIDVGFNQLLASGTRISSRLAVAWADILTGNMRSGLVKILSATIIQPLGRGSDRRVVLENLTQAERDTLYQIRIFNRFRKTFVVSIITQYYLILQQHDVFINARENYRSLARIHHRMRELTEVGKLPMHELERVHQDRLDALDAYIKAEKLYAQSIDEFKLQLSLPTTAKLQLDTSELDALEIALLNDPNFTEAQAVSDALGQRLDLANTYDAVDDAERKILVAADNMGVELNFVGSIERASKDRTDFATVKRRESTVLNAALEIDLDLDRKFEKNEYRKSLITLTQRQRDYEQAVDTVVLEIRQAYRDLSEAAQLYRVQSESLELAKKRLQNTYMLVDYGRASSRRILNAQANLLKAQNATTTALIGYTVATLNFYRDTGTLQVRPDGMWEQELIVGK